MEKIIIVIVTDDRYVQHLGVMLTSLFENKKTSNPIEFNIISNGLISENEEKLTRLLCKYNAFYKFINVDDAQYKHLSVKNHMSHAAYYKISIPELCYQYDKVLFLDCDLVVKADITELWNVDLGQKHLAAVENPEFDRYEQLKIPIGSKTFNSGVMLINLAAWRVNDIPKKVLEFLHNNSHKTALHDQDGFNAVMYDKWLPLRAKWNQQTKFFEIHYSSTDFNESEFKEALHNPAIIHYTTASKPWHYVNSHPFKKDYYDYLFLTDWKTFRPKDKSIKNIIKKFVMRLLPNKILKFVRRTRMIRRNNLIYK
ncbi:glycosyltransferase family 8 protein [Paenibacillus tarimensis]